MERLMLAPGIRVENFHQSLHLGVGYTWITEKALVIDFLFWAIHIGMVYNDSGDQ